MFRRCAMHCAPPTRRGGGGERRRSMQYVAATREEVGAAHSRTGEAPDAPLATFTSGLRNPHTPGMSPTAGKAEGKAFGRALFNQHKYDMSQMIHKQRVSLLSDGPDAPEAARARAPRRASGPVLTDLSALEHQATEASSPETMMYSIGWAVQLECFGDERASVYADTSFYGFEAPAVDRLTRWKLSWQIPARDTDDAGWNSILVGKVPGYLCVWCWDGRGVVKLRGGRHHVVLTGTHNPHTDDLQQLTEVGQLLAVYPDGAGSYIDDAPLPTSHE